MAEYGHMVGAGNCKTCAGCGYVANDDERSPWTHWANLPPGADLAVRLGIVKRGPCPDCNGSGSVEAPSP
jgi:hypothetical protein